MDHYVVSQLIGLSAYLYQSNIEKGEKIIEYKGEIIDWNEYIKRVAIDKDGYLFFINNQKCIDAWDTPQHKARYANDAHGLSRYRGLTNNSVYEIEDDKCYIVSTKKIVAGEEIFVDYTKDYWDCIRYNIKNNLYQTRKSRSKSLSAV